MFGMGFGSLRVDFGVGLGTRGWVLEVHGWIWGYVMASRVRLGFQGWIWDFRGGFGISGIDPGLRLGFRRDASDGVGIFLGSQPDKFCVGQILLKEAWDWIWDLGMDLGSRAGLGISVGFQRNLRRVSVGFQGDFSGVSRGSQWDFRGPSGGVTGISVGFQ